MTMTRLDAPQVLKTAFDDETQALRVSVVGVEVEAENVIYDNADSGLTSDNAQGAIDELAAKCLPVVASYYGLGGILAYSAGDVIKYLTATVDTNSAYDSATGLFTCPADGAYRISNHGNSPTSDSYTYVGKNSNVELFRLAFISKVNGEGNGEAVVMCAEGDELGVYAANTQTQNGGDEYSFVTFQKIT